MTILLAFDPGSRRSAWALVESRGASPQPIACTFLAGGMLDSTPRAFDALLDNELEFAPDVIAIESIEGFAFSATSKRGGGQAVVKALLETSKVVGTLAAMSRGRARVVEMTARSWRKIVCGRANATDAVIKATVTRLVHGVPRTSAHVRDAVGLAVGTVWSRGGRG